jgi:hypothetical protein
MKKGRVACLIFIFLHLFPFGLFSHCQCPVINFFWFLETSGYELLKAAESFLGVVL